MSTLYKGGLRILFLFEVLVFTFHGRLRADTTGCKRLQRTAEGCRVCQAGSIERWSPDSDGKGSVPALNTSWSPLAVEDGTGSLDQMDSAVMGVKHAAGRCARLEGSERPIPAEAAEGWLQRQLVY